jgi:aminoglycoside phosphotransferase (APT) family kinase protein
LHREGIDTELVRRLIAAQFPGWAGIPVRKVEPGGWDNVTVRLGAGMVVRLPSSASYAAQVEKEQQWLPVLAPRLPLPVPTPLALGEPGLGYPWHWSVYTWIEGETLARHRLRDPARLAGALASFLRALQSIDAAGGPPPGDHNFGRGGPLERYDAEARAAIAQLGGSVDTTKALAVWEAALGSRWGGAPVWLHGDVSAANLLLGNGELSAVIDLGCCAVGDPACDLMPAWSFFQPAERATFRAALPLDPQTWARARGWALWKAAITLAAGAGRSGAAGLVLAQVLSDPDRLD